MRDEEAVMSSSEYTCLLGLSGECRVMRRLAEEASRADQQLRMVKPAIPETVSPEIRKELEAIYEVLFREIFRVLSTTYMSPTVGSFCSACIKLKELKGEIRRI